MPWPDNPPRQLPIAEQLEQLRERVLGKMRIEITERKTHRPMPTEEEIMLGGYVEYIEPQVRDAVREFNRKGYETTSSGFFRGPLQDIDGDMKLTTAETTAIETAGATAEQSAHGNCYVSFIPDSADITAIKQHWQKIATALPDRGQPARPSHSSSAVDFRRAMAKYIFAEPDHWRSFGDTAFLVLNDVIDEKTAVDCQNRNTSGEPPTPDELDMGYFREYLPAHMRKSVSVMRRKGYEVSDYQASWPYPQDQLLTGENLIQTETERDALGSCSARLLTPYSENKTHQRIIITIQEPDVELIAQQWQRLAEALPDRGHTAAPANNLAADEFREKFGRK